METIKKEITDVLSHVKDAKIDINISRGVGSNMGELHNVGQLQNEEKVTIKHEPGQVILLDFWATWCPPCQKPMAHNQEMLEHHKDDWKNVRIIGLSIDQDK